MKKTNENAMAALEALLSDARPGRMYQSLTRLFIDYLFYNADGLPVDFDNILDDLERLLRFLAVVCEEEIGLETD
ncbi:hypothetical protein VRU48_17550 [Pedobacter sp. KR3-3]|uniref:Uncharacterized protein n=1 Tax=Pedobacter albus TaxID=3113905 RepID=A0ABU7IBU3_9SPHI|nr:hypothetical protein [Pedobacter sp. KR3-3]MEE1946936.1 hypothetical protein [Pedobacter sp. KR3-3]